jgi:hypothetical protein
MVNNPGIKPATATQSSPLPTITIVYPTSDTDINPISGTFYISWQYSVNSTFSWVGYSLNGTSWTPGGNHTVTGKNETRLFSGQDGNYTFTLYANDTAGNWISPQTVSFRVHNRGDELQVLDSRHSGLLSNSSHYNLICSCSRSPCLQES